MALIARNTRHVVLIGDDISVTVNVASSSCVCKPNSTVNDHVRCPAGGIRPRQMARALL